MGALTGQGLVTGDFNPLKQEIDRIVAPVATTYDEALKYKSMLTLLFSDQETYDLLYDFAQRYWKATHPIELAQMGASAVSDIVVTVILAIVSAGIGAAANVIAKSSRLVKVAKLLEKIATTLKRIGPRTRLLDKGQDAAKKAAKIEKRAANSSRKGMPMIESPKKVEKLEGQGKKGYSTPKKEVGPETTKKTGPLSAEKANEPHLARGNRPPYAVGTRARDIVLKEDRVFLRVHGEGNKARSWMAMPDEIKGLTPAQIKDKFALPEMPTYISEVHVPAGTRIRVGTVGAQEGWGTGGKIQYELLQRMPESAFKNTRPLP